MELRLAVHLPRDLDQLNTVRHLLDGALETLGVDGTCRADIGLIVSEAYTNALSHLSVGTQYRVVVTVEGDDLTVTVDGPCDGPDSSSANVLAESGRGAHIIEELADTMLAEPGGLLRSATKALTWADRDDIAQRGEEVS